MQGKVVVIRGEGPKGGPGMPEMLTPTSAIMGAGLGKVWLFEIHDLVVVGCLFLLQVDLKCFAFHSHELCQLLDWSNCNDFILTFLLGFVLDQANYYYFI